MVDFEVIGSNRATTVEILLRHSGPILSDGQGKVFKLENHTVSKVHKCVSRVSVSPTKWTSDLQFFF